MSFCPSALFAVVGGGDGELTVFEGDVDAGDGGGAAHCILCYVWDGAAGGKGDVMGCSYWGAVGEG